MSNPADALAAAARPLPRTAQRAQRVLVIGGGGALGAEVLEQLLGSGGFERVGVLAAPALQPALRGLQPVADDDAAWRVFAPDTALIVFDRVRHANGRDAAFVRAEPAALARWAARLHAHGVRTLVVVVPHAPGLLPQALQQGLASLDEGAVAALGFEHLVFMRMAQAAGVLAQLRSAPQRLAHWMLSQLHWMLPQREQPVRAATVARVAAQLARALPAAAPGTRVLPHALVWAAAQSPRGDTLVDDWLAGRPLRLPQARRQRW